MRSHRHRLACTVAVACGVLGAAGSAAANPIKLLTLNGVAAEHSSQSKQAAASGAIVPPGTPCPENGLLPNPSVSGLTFVPNCGIPELPVAAGEPYPGQMSYYGGHVQTHPREYLVLWGWDLPGAFSKSCAGGEHTSAISEPGVSIDATTSDGVASTASSGTVCDPDGAAKYMADFVSQIGGTQWANVQNQYYESDPSGTQYVDENGNLLAGIWIDDSHGGDLSKTSSQNTPGPTNTYTQMALEATRAAAHFGVSGDALKNANFIIAQPQQFSDPQAATTSSLIGYCAFHDYTLFGATGNADYDPKLGVGQDISYTNMPYTLNAGAGCGQGIVNQPGTLDAYSIGLGHEIQETVTDPGAEDVIGNVLSGGTSYYGGWYDQLDGNENGDKCAYVGISPTAGLPGTPYELPIPGAMGNIKGDRGETFAVQALWSDAAAGGAGWCSGVASTDLPSPLSGEPPYSAKQLAAVRTAGARHRSHRRAHRRAKRSR